MVQPIAVEDGLGENWPSYRGEFDRFTYTSPPHRFELFVSRDTASVAQSLVSGLAAPLCVVQPPLCTMTGRGAKRLLVAHCGPCAGPGSFEG